MPADGEVDRGARNVPGREPSRGLSESTLARAEGRDRVEDALDGCRSLGLIILQLIQGAERRGEERSVVVSELRGRSGIGRPGAPSARCGEHEEADEGEEAEPERGGDEASDGGEACAGRVVAAAKVPRVHRAARATPAARRPPLTMRARRSTRSASARGSNRPTQATGSTHVSRPGSPAIPPVKPSSSASRTVMAGALAPRLFSSSSMAPSPAWLARSPATARAIGSWRNRSANRRIPNTPIAAPDPAARAAARVVAPQADISTATTSAPLSQPRIQVTRDGWRRRKALGTKKPPNASTGSVTSARPTDQPSNARRSPMKDPPASGKIAAGRRRPTKVAARRTMVPTPAMPSWRRPRA